MKKTFISLTSVELAKVSGGKKRFEDKNDGSKKDKPKDDDSTAKGATDGPMPAK